MKQIKKKYTKSYIIKEFKTRIVMINFEVFNFQIVMFYFKENFFIPLTLHGSIYILSVYSHNKKELATISCTLTYDFVLIS